MINFAMDTNLPVTLGNAVDIFNLLLISPSWSRIALERIVADRQF